MSVLYPYGGKPSLEHTTIGFHLHPGEYHSFTLLPQQREAHIPYMKQAGANWCVMMTNGDSCLQVVDGKEAVRWYLDEGIVPIIRDDTVKFPDLFNNYETVRRAAAIYADYGLRPTWIDRNEQGDPREWLSGKTPENWKEIALGVFLDAAPKIIDAGATVAFADPLSDWSFFFQGMSGVADLWRDGLIVMAAHLYNKARPLNFPEDDVTRDGAQLTEEQWRKELDDYWDVPGWREQTLEQINQARVDPNWMRPGARWYDKNPDGSWAEHTCFGAWRNIRQDAWDAFGCEIAMCMTEGGPTPKSQADGDIRYSPMTLKRGALEAVKTINATDHGMYAVCFWLLWEPQGYAFASDRILNGMHNWVINQDTGEPYGYAAPIIEALGNIQSQPDIVEEVRWLSEGIVLDADSILNLL